MRLQPKMGGSATLEATSTRNEKSSKYIFSSSKSLKKIIILRAPQAVATRDDLLTQRAEEVARLAAQLEEAGRIRVGLEMRCLELEELRDR